MFDFIRRRMANGNSDQAQLRYPLSQSQVKVTTKDIQATTKKKNTKLTHFEAAQLYLMISTITDKSNPSIRNYCKRRFPKLRAWSNGEFDRSILQGKALGEWLSTNRFRVVRYAEGEEAGA